MHLIFELVAVLHEFPDEAGIGIGNRPLTVGGLDGRDAFARHRIAVAIDRQLGADVAALGGIDADEASRTFPMHRLLSRADIDAVFIDHGVGQQVISRAVAAKAERGSFEIDVEFPQHLAASRDRTSAPIRRFAER